MVRRAEWPLLVELNRLPQFVGREAERVDGLLLVPAKILRRVLQTTFDVVDLLDGALQDRVRFLSSLRVGRPRADRERSSQSNDDEHPSHHLSPSRLWKRFNITVSRRAHRARGAWRHHVVEPFDQPRGHDDDDDAYDEVRTRHRSVLSARRHEENRRKSVRKRYAFGLRITASSARIRLFLWKSPYGGKRGSAHFRTRGRGARTRRPPSRTRLNRAAREPLGRIYAQMRS